MDKRQPVTVHPSELIADELCARGWTLDDLALRIAVNEHGLAPNDLARRVAEREYGIAYLAIEIYFTLGKDGNASHRIGVLGKQLDDAFGLTRGTFEDLHEAYLAGLRVPPESGGGDA